MITQHRNRTIINHVRDNLQTGAGISPITQQVAQKNILLGTLEAGMDKAGAQSLQIAVYIRKNRYFHTTITLCYSFSKCNKPAL